MLFTVEALRARHGDSLIIHFGDTEKPRLIVVDGGPSGVYKDALRPRLDQLADKLAGGGPLPIEILMVSHIDDDHLRGVLDLSAALLESQASKGLPFDVRTLWHNSFDGLIGNGAEELAAGVADAPARVASGDGPRVAWSGDARAVVASVAQGRWLRDNARPLGWATNRPFDRFVMAPSSGGATTTLGPLKLTVVCPLRAQLEALEKDWEKKLRELQRAKRAKEAAAVAEYLDRSVYNLSSIVCLAELEGKRVLLTGDARDHILEGLAVGGLLAGGGIELDVLKLPHHGSDRNVDVQFFRTVRARHYVASGDGEHHNPEVETFRMISTARADDDYTVHLTYRDFKEGVGEELEEFFAQERASGRRYEVAYRAPDDLSLMIDLLDEVRY